MELLLANGAGVNVKTSNGLTAVAIARRAGKVELNNLLVKHGGEPS